MKYKLLSLMLIIPLVISACGVTPPKAAPVQPIDGLPPGTDGFKWWNDTVFYEIFVRSFSDSNGDGIGDFNGITQKLDYLKQLGISGIWLMPINPSPSYHGYDVTDYKAVNPEYGTMDEFKTLLREAHKRGIRVIIDLVANHTSSQHPWFIEAQNTESPYRNFYVWSRTNPGYKGPWGEQVWFSTPEGYYYALFSQNMPDLNYENQEVTTQMDSVAEFWLKEIGIDGFRLDAALHIVEDGKLQSNTPATHTWLGRFYTYYKGIAPEAIVVGELNGESANVMNSYVGSDQLDLAFDFPLANSMLFSATTGMARNALGQMRVSYKTLPELQDATFLTNHDQDRLMNVLGNDPKKVKIAASMLLTSPGVPFLYYGEEVGLKGGGQDPDKRRPMQWCADQFACFSTVAPWEDVGNDYQTYNVQTEQKDAQSIFSHYQALITLRNEHAALRVGDAYLPNSDAPGLFVDLRQSKQEKILVVINLSKTAITNYSIDLSQSTLPVKMYRALPLMGGASFADITIDSNGKLAPYQPTAEIPPYTTLIMQLN